MRNTQPCTHSHAYHAEKHQPVAASQSSGRPHRSVRQRCGQCLTPVQTTVKLQLHPLLPIPRHAVGDRSLTSTNQTTIQTPAHRRHQHLWRTETQCTLTTGVFATSQMSHMYSNPLFNPQQNTEGFCSIRSGCCAVPLVHLHLGAPLAHACKHAHATSRYCLQLETPLLLTPHVAAAEPSIDRALLSCPVPLLLLKP